MRNNKVLDLGQQEPSKKEQAQNADEQNVLRPLCDEIRPSLCLVQGPNWTQASPKRSQETPRLFTAKTNKLAKAFDTF